MPEPLTLRQLAEEALNESRWAEQNGGIGDTSDRDAAIAALWAALDAQEATLDRIRALPEQWERQMYIDCLDSDNRDRCVDELRAALDGKDGPQ